jgi:transcriptional regulator with XRE-family HTH domain
VLLLNIGERIKKLRELKKWTQKELGDHVNKSAQVVSNWERNYTPAIAHDDILSLAKALETSPNYLLGKLDTSTTNTPDDERIKALLRSAEDLTDKEKDILFEEVANYLEYQKQKIRRTKNGGANKQ